MLDHSLLTVLSLLEAKKKGKIVAAHPKAREAMPVGTELEWRVRGRENEIKKHKVVKREDGHWYWAETCKTGHCRAKEGKIARRSTVPGQKIGGSGDEDKYEYGQEIDPRDPARYRAAVPKTDQEDPRYKKLSGVGAEYFPGVRAMKRGVKDPSDCPDDDVFVPFDSGKGGRCHKGVMLARDIDDLVEGALRHQDSRSWYRDMNKTAKALFGSDAPKFLAILAATSLQMPLDVNFRMALDIYKNHLAGTYPEGVSEETKSKAFKIDAIKQNTERALAGDFELSGPKIGAFTKNLHGDEEAITIDRHMLKLFYGLDPMAEVLRKDPDDPKKDPTWKDEKVALHKAFLFHAQKKVQEIADHLKWTPAETQAALWVFWFKDLRDYDDPSATRAYDSQGELITDYLTVLEASQKQGDNLIGEIQNLLKKKQQERRRPVKKQRRKPPKKPSAPSLLKKAGRKKKTAVSSERKRGKRGHTRLVADMSREDLHNGQIEILLESLFEAVGGG